MSFDALQRAARSGDAGAQLQLGIAFMTGQGAPGQDAARGREWLSRAAAGGNRDAQRFLGLIYLRGMDVVPDYGHGVRYLEQASDHGDPEAAWFLAGFLGGARDEHYDLDRARQLLERAAGAGHGRAQAHLAYCQLKGLGGPVDIEAAVSGFLRAAAAGDGGAMLAVAEFCSAGFHVPRDAARAYWLARAAADRGWLLADEVAEGTRASLAADPPRPVELLPNARETGPLHEGALLAPALSMVSWEPRVVTIRNFLSNFECAEIVNNAAEHLMPSFIVAADGSMGKHQIRTSQEVRMRPGLRNVVVNAVERKMAEWSHCPLENGEFPLILRYEKSQSFEQHFDFFIPEKFAMGEGPLEYGGQRIATQLVYLNERFSGGQTRFDNAGIEVRPERGLCILFYNVLPNHNVDPLTRHTGVAVEKGVKWLMSRWIREIPFDQKASDLMRDQYRRPGASEA